MKQCKSHASPVSLSSLFQFAKPSVQGLQACIPCMHVSRLAQVQACTHVRSEQVLSCNSKLVVCGLLTSRSGCLTLQC